MKVLLVDADSTIPNLALMKLSAYHKARGDTVGLHVEDPDKIYASLIFKKNEKLLSGLHLMYPEAEIEIGGSGYDLHKWLPPEVEELCPDYELYPNMDYSMGFTSRGCIRKCYFCWVPIKEGKLKRWQHPEHWVRHKKAMLLDNNWLANKEWFFETSQWFIDNGVAVDARQGLDIRMVTPESAKQLYNLTHYEKITFAFDDEKIEDSVVKGIETLKAAGINPGSIQFYVYCHNDAHYDSTLYRCNKLKELGAGAYIMCNQENPITPRVKRLRAWANGKFGYWTCEFKDYAPSKHHGERKRIKKPDAESLEVFE